MTFELLILNHPSQQCTPHLEALERRAIVLYFFLSAALHPFCGKHWDARALFFFFLFFWAAAADSHEEL